MKKRTFVTVFLALMVVATAAYAYFTWSTTISNNVVTTGEMKFTSFGGPIDARDLMPGGPAKVFFIGIRNDSPVPAVVKGYLGNFAGDLPTDMVNVKITMNPTDSPWDFGPSSTFQSALGPNYPVGVSYGGPVFKMSDLFDPMSHKLATCYWNGSSTVLTEMAPGFGASYKVEVSLSPLADNNYAKKWASCDFTWAGFQVEDAAF
jgi:hypothetical protein